MNTAHPIGHIDLRLNNLKEAIPFYQAFLPLLGYTRFQAGEGYAFFSAGKPCPDAFFCLNESPGHQANENRIAFFVSSREQVDTVASAVQKSNPKAFEAPGFCPEYSPSYYAAFFEDPSGNRLEVYTMAPDEL